MKTKVAVLGLSILLGAASLATAGGLNVVVNVGGANRGYCAPPVAYCAPVYAAPVYYTAPVVTYYNGPAVNYSTGYTTVRTGGPVANYYGPLPPPLQPQPVSSFGWRR